MKKYFVVLVLAVAALWVTGCIISATPSGDVVMKPCQTQVFSIVDLARDPKTYQWTLDGTPIPGVIGDSFEYKPTCSDVGVHMLSVTILWATHTWQVTVEDCPSQWDNLFARVRGGCTGWEMAVGTQPVDGSNPAHQWADLGANQVWDSNTTYTFTFAYHADTGLATFQVGGYNLLTTKDVGFVGYGFNVVKIVGIGRSGGSIDLSNLVFNSAPQPAFHIGGGLWQELPLHSGSYLDDIEISGDFVLQGDYYGMSELTKFQIELWSACLQK